MIGFGFGIGFGIDGQSSDRQTTSGGGQLAGEPSNGKLQAPAGGVTGASEHIDNKNSGNITTNLFIFPINL